MPPRPRVRVANPPERPLVLYDGTCGFCKTWIARWRERTGEAVDYAPSQAEGARFPEIPPEAFPEAVQLVLPDGSVLSGAESVARLLALPRGRGVFDWMYRRVPGAAPLADFGYRIVAEHRSAAAAVTRAALGPIGPAAHLPRGERALLAAPRSLLPRGLRLVLGPGGRPGRRARDPPHRSLPRLGPVPGRSRALLARPHALLARIRQRGAPCALRGRGARVAPPRRGGRAGGRRVSRVALLPLGGGGGTALPGVPVGLSPARDGPPGDLPRPAAALARGKRPGRLRAVAVPPRVAPLPSDAVVGDRQALERRPDVAQPDRPAVPLRDPVPSALDGVVRAQRPAVVPDVLVRRGLLRRARRSLLLLRPPAAAAHRVRADGLPAARDRRNGQLCLLQLADGGARRPAGGRRELSPPLAGGGDRGVSATARLAPARLAGDEERGRAGSSSPRPRGCSRPPPFPSSPRSASARRSPLRSSPSTAPGRPCGAPTATGSSP